jgi:trigger factor
MNVEVESKDLTRTLTIEDEGEKVKNIVESIYKDLSQKVSVPGFRQGKVPKSVIKAKYKDYIAEEAVKQYINKYLPEILEQHDLKPISQIFFGDVDLEGDNKIKFKVSFEVSPEFELKPYEGIEVETVEAKVSDEDVEKAIQTLLEKNAKYIPVDKEVEEGDTVKIKYHIKAESGEEEEDEFETVVGAGTLRKEIEEKLIGKKVGDKVKVENIDLIDEQGKPKGKADVEVEILEVMEKEIPEFNEEFVKEIGLGENVEEAKKKIREDLEKELQEIRKREIEQKIIDKLAEEYDFPVPESLVNAETEFLAQEYAKQLESYGIKPNKEMIEAALENLKQTAEKNVRISFVLNKIAEKENIQVTDEELNEELQKLAQAYQTTPETLRKYLEEQGTLDNIRFNILRNKVLEFLMEKANIKEISKEEYEKKLKEQAEEEQKKTENENIEETSEEIENKEETVENKEA